MVFTMTDGTTSSNTVQQLMPNIIKALSDKYGPVKIRFSVVNVGSTPKIEFDYNTVALPDKESVRKQVTKLAPIAGAPDIKKALVEVEKIFNASASIPRPNARRINLIVTDKKFGVPMAELEKAVEPLERIGVQQIAVSIGDKPNMWELKKMTRSDSKILEVSESTSPTEIGDKVMRVIMNGKLSYAMKTCSTCWSGLRVATQKSWLWFYCCSLYCFYIQHRSQDNLCSYTKTLPTCK